jgi:PAS domain-containing protein
MGPAQSRVLAENAETALQAKTEALVTFAGECLPTRFKVTVRRQNRMSASSSEHREPSSPPAAKTIAEVLLSKDLLETLPDAVIAVDRYGTIVQVNSQAQELFGYAHEELIGQKVEMLVPGRKTS